ncbi:hypothetical protein KQ486_09790, partial [Allobacillus halotolerans]
AVPRACRAVPRACRAAARVCRAVPRACRAAPHACWAVPHACRAVARACRAVARANRLARQPSTPQSVIMSSFVKANLVKASIRSELVKGIELIFIKSDKRKNISPFY